MDATKIALFGIQIVYTLGFPWLALWMGRRYKIAATLGPVVLCYAFGITLANLGAWFPRDAKLAQELYENTVPLAIPLLLFSTNFPRWLRISRVTLLSFALMLLSVLVSATLTYLWLGKSVEEGNKVAGMLVGMYTGGTPNMNAIGLALDVKKHIFPLVNASDLFLGGIYLFFLLSLAKPLFRLFLPPFPHPTPLDEHAQIPIIQEEQQPSRSFWLQTALAIGLAILIVALSLGLTLAIRRKLDIALIILAITTFGIAASFVPKIRGLQGSYEAGDYLLLCFATALGTSVDLRLILQTDITAFFLYTTVIMLGAIGLHLFLAFLLRIDVDTAIITSAAGIFGPPFIPAIVRAINNRDVLVSGLTTGIIGYAVGNYLGISLAYFLARL